MKRNWLPALFPTALALSWFGADPIVSAASALALVPLAAFTEDAADALASSMGPTRRSLLSASLCNARKLVIGFFALRQGLASVVKASLTGSITGNRLFAPGLSMFAGGFRHGTQNLSKVAAAMNGGPLSLTATGRIFAASPPVGREHALRSTPWLTESRVSSLFTSVPYRRPADPAGSSLCRYPKTEAAPTWRGCS